MCVKCGIGNIKKGIRVFDWHKGKAFFTYTPCDCVAGIQLKNKLIAKHILTGNNPNLTFNAEEAAKDVNGTLC